LQVVCAVATFDAEIIQMKYILTIITGLLFSLSSSAQYYYNDVVANKISNNQQKILKQNKIRSVKAVSKEADNTIVEGFSVEQKINSSATEIITTSKSTLGKASILTSSYADGKIVKTNDESDGVQTITEYVYDEIGLLKSVISSTIDTSMNSATSESHDWYYNTNGTPIKMIKIKNNTDTTVVQFVLDDKGFVGEEHWKRKGRNAESYYYYYNEAGLITDIVRYNSRVKKMLPDFVYEYDAAGRVKQMIQVLAGGSNYNTWKYAYNENGLKQKETCYDKQKQLVGVIEYIYNN
jgi:hypothetical protein